MWAVPPEEFNIPKITTPEVIKTPGVIIDGISLESSHWKRFWLRLLIEKYLNSKTTPLYSQSSIMPTDFLKQEQAKDWWDTPSLSLLGQDAIRRHPYIIDVIIDQKIIPVLIQEWNTIDDVSKIEIDHKWQLILTIQWKPQPIISDLSTRVIESTIIQNQSALDRKELQTKWKTHYLYWGLIGAIWVYDTFGKTFEIRKLEVNISGNPEIIDIWKQFHSNWKINNQRILRALEAKWVIIEPSTWKFIKIETFAPMSYRESIRRITKYKYVDFLEDQKKIGIEWKISEAEFKADKTKTLGLLKTLNQKQIEMKYQGDFRNFIKTPYSLLKFAWHGIGIALIPMFTEHLRKNTQDLGAHIHSGISAGGFLVWAKYGWKAWSKMPGPAPVKAISWTILALVAGGWAVLWIDELWKEMEMWRSFTKHVANREDFLEKQPFLEKWIWFDEHKSITWHALSSFWMNEILDTYSNIRGKDTHAFFYQTQISLDTNPREYLLSRAPILRSRNESVDTDIEFWNVRVDSLQERFIHSLRKKLQSWKSKEENIANIRDFIYKGNVDWNSFSTIHKNVQDNIMVYIEKKDGDGNYVNYDKIVSGKDEIFYDYVAFEINKLKINSSYLKSEKQDIELNHKSYIDEAIEWDISGPYIEYKYIGLLPEKEREFIRAVFYRTINIESIIRNDGQWEWEKVNEKQLWKDLMWNTYFFTWELTPEDKSLLVKLYSINNEWGKELENILNNTIVNTKDYPWSIWDFLRSVISWSARSLTIKTTRVEWIWPLHEETDDTLPFDNISEKSDGWKHFYEFFKRMIDYKRKNEFIKSMQEHWTATSWDLL